MISVTSEGSRDTKIYFNSVLLGTDTQSGLGSLQDIKDKYKAILGNN